MRLDYSGTKIIQIFIVTNRLVILNHVVVQSGQCLSRYSQQP
jgi:hypothetical protein